MIFRPEITSEELDNLPIAQFDGEIVIIDSLDSNYYRAIEYLRVQKIIGFDTETKPSFTANTKRHTVALLQLATNDIAFLFRLQKTGIPADLAAILSSEKILKIGAAVNDDIKALQHHTKFKPAGFIDLQSIASSWGVNEKSVRKMAAIILGIRVSKSQQLSNWESQELTDSQAHYAAIDAWICQLMYRKLSGVPKNKNG